MNEVLTRHYIDMPTISSEIKNMLCAVKSDSALYLLNDIVGDWTYEILREEYLDDGTAYHVVIALYMPGVVRTGVGMSNIDFGREHKFEAIRKAIVNALSTLAGKVGGSNPVNSDTKAIENQKTEVDKAPINNGVNSDNTPQANQNTQRRSSRYTQEQIAGIEKFKKDYEIENNEQFVKYLRAWNPNITEKKQLTPDIVDDFLAWINQLNDNGI